MYKASRCFIIAIARQTFLHKAFLLLATPFLFGNYKMYLVIYSVLPKGKLQKKLSSED